MNAQISLQVVHLHFLEIHSQNMLFNYRNELCVSFEIIVGVFGHKLIVLAFDSFQLGRLSSWLSGSHFVGFFLLYSIAMMVASKTRTLAVKHDGFFDQIDHILKSIESLDIRF